jgi:hypothetical protein
MEQARKARARKQDGAGENAARIAEPLHHRDKAVGEPARAGEQEEVPAAAKDREQAGAPAVVAEKAAVIGSNKSIYPVKYFEENERSEFNWGHSTNQRHLKEVILCQDLTKQVPWVPGL